MKTDLIQDGGQVKRQTDIDHHGPKYILIICHLPDPPIFSLPTTFKSYKYWLSTFVYTFIAGLREQFFGPQANFRTTFRVTGDISERQNKLFEDGYLKAFHN
jgi:hypothetical protein